MDTTAPSAASSRTLTFLRQVIGFCESLTGSSGRPVAAEISPDLRSVFTVEFERGELDEVHARANAAGLTISQYIRSRALAP